MKKIAALLCVLFLAAANLLATESYQNIPTIGIHKMNVSTKSGSVVCMDSGDNVRVATQDEINGKQVDLPLDQPLVVTIESDRQFSNTSGNNYVFGANITTDSSILDIESSCSMTGDSSQFSGIITQLTLLCTPITLGFTTLSIVDTGAQINKTMNINVIAPNGLN